MSAAAVWNRFPLTTLPVIIHKYEKKNTFFFSHSLQNSHHLSFHFKVDTNKQGSMIEDSNTETLKRKKVAPQHRDFVCIIE
jgi:hypothetical protein